MTAYLPPVTGQPDPANDTLFVRAALLAALLAGLLLRLYRLDAGSLWYDETVSVYLAGKAIPALIAHTAGDIHPPGYYLLLHGWRHAVTPTLAHGLEFLYAWLSVGFGMLVLALLFPIGRRLFGARPALLAVWLAAINPFHIWYSQEVRMYTLAATLGLVCLWALIKYLGWRSTPTTRTPERAGRWLAAYVVLAACGLYTLYYFLFLLAALNLLALMLIWVQWREGASHTRRRLLVWLAAQIGVLLLWLPWLPVFWRQATDPPVPPWRVAWRSWPEFGASLVESLAAQLVGQTPPGGILWPWALVAVAIIVLALVATRTDQARRNARARSRWSLIALLGYIVAPAALIYLVSALATPLYHVRYLFTYAPPYMLIMAIALLYLANRSRWAGGIAGAVVVIASAWGLQQLWSNPVYASDDHRAAVAQLAEEWRPGDLILVNAGWVYPVLSTYWPTELVGADGHVPPPLAAITRLAADGASPAANAEAVTLVTTGSIDAPASLGWGDPASDFYAISADETQRALAQLAAEHPRIWHYRLYDTVNDPAGVIRSWLEANSILRQDTAYAGRDFLRVQRFDLPAEAAPPPEAVQDGIEFGNLLRLEAHSAAEMQRAGELLFVDLFWSLLDQPGEVAPELATSLRLYDADGRLISQRDRGLELPAQAQAGSVRQPMALPIPAATKPGIYTLELVVYHRQDGSPLALPDDPRVIVGQRWRLGDLTVTLPRLIPETGREIASFDYIDLLEAQPERLAVLPGEQLPVRLVWRPRPNAYRDAYVATLILRDDAGKLVQQWPAPAGGRDYGSGMWPAHYPIAEWRDLAPTPDLLPGQYSLGLTLQRASDGLAIPARQSWLRTTQPEVEIAQLSIGPQAGAE